MPASSNNVQFWNAALADEISKAVRYFDSLVNYRPLPHDSGAVLEAIDCPQKISLEDMSGLDAVPNRPEARLAVLLNGTLNYSLDVQQLLSDLLPVLSRNSRVFAVLYNPYLKPLYQLCNAIGLRRAPIPETFLTVADIEALAKLSGFDIVDYTLCGYFPWSLGGLGRLVNGIFSIVPLLRWLAHSCVVTLRPTIPSTDRPGLSVVIPARNEFGNIESALRRMPDLGCPLEVIFIEGHSTDQTWEEIQRVSQAYASRLRILTAQQSGKGKSDAVRLGFSMATMPLLTILDADLTMPPEMLGRFYKAYLDGLGDFVNGTRLVYPMEGDAMRFLNHLGNVFFAKSLSYVLNTRLSDSLCGTKLMARHDYARMVAWRSDFGDFDPFGDFEMLFPACILHLGVINIPIRYAARTYGSTNISRFRHGFQLLRMTMIGFFRIKCGFS